MLSQGEQNSALICDVPGMGKTWLMESLVRSIRNDSHDSLVFYIQLSPFSQFLAETVNSTDAEDVLDVLFEYVLNSTLSRKLWGQQCNKNDIHLTVVLDGFDEIRDDQVGSTAKFLTNLNISGKVTMVISSRPHMRPYLEETFNAMSYDILPFAIEDQVKTVVEHWREVWPSGDINMLLEFARQCVISIERIRTKDSSDILGVPLKCYILAVVNETHAGQVSSLQHPLKLSEVEPIESVPQLYERFVLISAKKLESFPQPAGFKQRLNQFHTFKALELLFPEVAPAYKSMFDLDTYTAHLVPKAGIMFASVHNEQCCLFEDASNSLLVNCFRTYPAENISPLAIAVLRKDLDMAFFFADKIKHTWQRLFVEFLFPGGALTMEDVNAGVSIIAQVVQCDDGTLSLFQDEYLVDSFLSRDEMIRKFMFCNPQRD